MKKSAKTIFIPQHLYIFIYFMESEQKRNFKGNIIKFIIWLVLLGFCYSYLLNHPAEKASIFSGFEVLWQRIEVFGRKVINDNPELLQRKFDYQKTYEELIKLAEDSKCIKDAGLLDEINETYIKFKSEKIGDLSKFLPWYIRKAQEYKAKIDNCKK